jgi:hypothetical protein
LWSPGGDFPNNTAGVIDPDVERIRWDETDLTFTATRWQLLEASLCRIPADSGSSIRAFGGVAGRDIAVRSRMLSRQRLHERAQAVIWKAHHE